MGAPFQVRPPNFSRGGSGEVGFLLRKCTLLDLKSTIFQNFSPATGYFSSFLHNIWWVNFHFFYLQYKNNDTNFWLQEDYTQVLSCAWYDLWSPKRILMQCFCTVKIVLNFFLPSEVKVNVDFIKVPKLRLTSIL